MHKEVFIVKKDWRLGQDNTEWWTNMCVWVMENYGLPGDNYTTKVSKDYMIFKFKNKEDAMVTALRWGNDE